MRKHPENCAGCQKIRYEASVYERMLAAHDYKREPFIADNSPIRIQYAKLERLRREHGGAADIEGRLAIRRRLAVRRRS